MNGIKVHTLTYLHFQEKNRFIGQRLPDAREQIWRYFC